MQPTAERVRAAAPPSVSEDHLREVVEALAPIERPPCSPGERRAAEWIAARLRRAGCEDVRLEEEPARGRYMPTLVGLGAVGSAGAVLALRGRGRVGALASLAAAAAIVDEAQNGPRWLRRVVHRRRSTVNVVAQAGDPRAERTLVVLAHHDAHQTGRLYDQGLQRAIHRVAPGLVARAKTSFPQWWLGLAGPLLTAAGAVSGRRGPLRAGLALDLIGTALVADVARSPTAPGANDNLSGVSGLVAVAELLREAPVAGLRVLLVSCGAEEALQDGIRPFMARHGAGLARDRTWFLNLETVGSPRLIMLEGEGPVWMEDYADPSFRDLVAGCAERAGIGLERGFRARASTDSVMPSRAGYATATLTSLTEWGALANYHLPTDTPENVEYRTVAESARLAYAVGEAIAAGAGSHAPAPAAGSRGRPPGPGGAPVLGSLAALRADPLKLFAEGAATYGDLVCFKVAHRRVYLVAGPKLIAHVGIHNRDNYVKGVSYEALRVPIEDALLTADGDTWRGRRRLLLPVFTRGALSAQVPAMAAAVEDTFERLDELAAAGRPFDVAREMNRLAFDVVGRVLMGAELRGAMAELEGLIGEASEWVARRTRALVPLPPGVPTPRNLAYRRAAVEIRAFADQLIAGRRAAGPGNDMVSRLIAAGDAEGGGMDDRQLRDEVIGFLMAGHQTTGAALAWTWHLLSTHPEAEDAVASEAAGVLDGKPPSAEDLERLTYLGQVLDESMRLFPPGWAFTRTPLADDDLGGHRVEAGSVVVISPYANQRNPRFWRDPGAFDPGRFSPGRRESIEPYHYFPFGVGPHACIGKNLALLEAKVAVAMLARRYRFEAAATGPVRPVPGITLTPAGPIMVRVHRRGRRDESRS